MKPKQTHHAQGRLFDQRLSHQLNPKHELIQLSKEINWKAIEAIADVYFEETGRKGSPTRLVIGILMLQQISGLSDEMAVSRWVENPYWQFFCGYDFLQWEFPIDPSTLVRWRRRIGKEGLEKIFAETIRTAKRTQTVKPASLKQVIADTTVMEKNICYPTDGKLYHKMREKLVQQAKRHDIELRQSYTRKSKKALFQAGRYFHARQMRRGKKEVKKIKTWLGRVVRDIQRKIENNREHKFYFQTILELAKRLLAQEKTSPNKIYSLHAPEVECIAKGKAGKKYEFGCKISLVVTYKEGLALNVEALHGNPFDGHTLGRTLEKAEELTGHKIKRTFVDKGYRGHEVKDKEVIISGQKKGTTARLKKMMRRRQAIEPHIGHMKSEGKLNRNYLKGKLGDRMNALLVGIGHNLRLILATLRRAKEEMSLLTG